MTQVLQPVNGPYLIRYLYRRRLFFGIVVLTAFLAAVTVTAILPRKYTSGGIVFPPGMYTADKAMENPPFGYHLQADRLIQIGESAAMKDSIVNRFDLYPVFGIGRQDKDARYRLHKALDRCLSFEKTKFMSVTVRASTKDPVLSANMANAAIDLLGFFYDDLMKRNVYKTMVYTEDQYRHKNAEVLALVDSMNRLRAGNAGVSIGLVRDQLVERQREIASLMDRMAEIRKTGGFYDYSQQVEQISLEVLYGKRQMAIEKGKMDALSEANYPADTTFLLSKGRFEGSMANEEALQKKLSELKGMEREYAVLSERIGREWDRFNELKKHHDHLTHTYQPYVESVTLTHLEKRYDGEMDLLETLKERYEAAFRYYYQPMTGIFVIDRAEPVYHHSSPSYRTNVPVAVFAALVLAVLLDLFRMRIREVIDSTDVP